MFAWMHKDCLAMPKSEPRAEKPQVDRPFTIKRLLMSYKVNAEMSLDGPNRYCNTSGETNAGGSRESPSPELKPLKPINNRALSDGTGFAPTPMLMMSDSSVGEQTDTLLEGATIACFVVGGEKRLCLPQILNNVLSGFNLGQINAVCDELHIFCSLCNSAQLEVLKRLAVLPASAPSCGLITKTDAERMCSTLLHRNATRGRHHGGYHYRPAAEGYRKTRHDVENAASAAEPVRVIHKCFGKCAGVFVADAYTAPTVPAIRCCECSAVFSTQQFVCHSHRALENRTCHWGFDSANWRNYVRLSKEYGVDEVPCRQLMLDSLKDRFNTEHNGLKRQQVGVVSEADGGRLVKKLRSEETTSCKVESDWFPALRHEDGDAQSVTWVDDLNATAPTQPTYSSESLVSSAAGSTFLPKYLETGLPTILFNPDRLIAQQQLPHATSSAK